MNVTSFVTNQENIHKTRFSEELHTHTVLRSEIKENSKVKLKETKRDVVAKEIWTRRGKKSVLKTVIRVRKGTIMLDKDTGGTWKENEQSVCRNIITMTERKTQFVNSVGS